MVTKLRNAFPPNVNSETVKKLGLAPNNESYVINALQFVGAIDEEGNKTDQAAEVFSKHEDGDFQNAFKVLVKKAYADLFELHGEAAWQLEKNDLITFFRNADQTSAVIGGRQANLFTTFSALSGHGELKVAKPAATSKANTAGKVKKPKGSSAKATENKGQDSPGKKIGEKPKGIVSDVGLSVRVEVNLPSDATPDAYDAIFSSIRKHLIDN